MADLQRVVERLKSELGRYGMDAGQADQCRNLALAALSALGMDYGTTSPNDVAAAIKSLVAERDAMRSACRQILRGWGHQDGVSRAVELARKALGES